MEQVSKWTTAYGQQNLWRHTIIKIATAPIQKVRTWIYFSVLPSISISIWPVGSTVHQWVTLSPVSSPIHLYRSSSFPRSTLACHHFFFSLPSHAVFVILTTWRSIHPFYNSYQELRWIIRLTKISKSVVHELWFVLQPLRCHLVPVF